jgi:hypothetical protein
MIHTIMNGCPVRFGRTTLKLKHLNFKPDTDTYVSGASKPVSPGKNMHHYLKNT